jgi:hypothetical protein
LAVNADASVYVVHFNSLSIYLGSRTSAGDGQLSVVGRQINPNGFLPASATRLTVMFGPALAFTYIGMAGRLMFYPTTRPSHSENGISDDR